MLRKRRACLLVLVLSERSERYSHSYSVLVCGLEYAYVYVCDRDNRPLGFSLATAGELDQTGL